MSNINYTSVIVTQVFFTIFYK